MKPPLPKTPGIRVLCPDNCKFRPIGVQFCGFCLAKHSGELDKDKEAITNANDAGNEIAGGREDGETGGA